MSTTPTQLLDRALQRKVELKLKDGREISGRLLGLDEHLNIVLDETEERAGDRTRRLGRIVLRGSQVTSLHVAAS
ncbi:MAG: LSM domain-containing protein [Thermoplasmata archaeon]